MKSPLCVESQIDRYVRATNSISNVPILWPLEGACLEYRLDHLDPQELSRDEAHAQIRQAFETWSSVDCSHVLCFEEAGLTDDSEHLRIPGYNENAPSNDNVVLFLSKNWQHSPVAVGATVVTSRVSDGEIVDADILFNDERYTFTTDSPTAEMGFADLLNTATHEVGHFIGLGHSTHVENTMFFDYEMGEIKKRDLADGDIQGICTLYSPACHPLP